MRGEGSFSFTRVCLIAKLKTGRKRQKEMLMQTAPASSFISSLYMLFSKINSSRNVYRCYNIKMNFLDRWQDSLPISNFYFCDSVISVAFNMCLYSRSQSGSVSPWRNNDIFNSRASFRSSMRRMEWHIPNRHSALLLLLSINKWLTNNISSPLIFLWTL